MGRESKCNDKRKLRKRRFVNRNKKKGSKCKFVYMTIENLKLE